MSLESLIIYLEMTGSNRFIFILPDDWGLSGCNVQWLKLVRNDMSHYAYGGKPSQECFRGVFSEERRFGKLLISFTANLQILHKSSKLHFAGSSVSLQSNWGQCAFNIVYDLTGVMRLFELKSGLSEMTMSSPVSLFQSDGAPQTLPRHTATNCIVTLQICSSNQLNLTRGTDLTTGMIRILGGSLLVTRERDESWITMEAEIVCYCYLAVLCPRHLLTPVSVPFHSVFGRCGNRVCDSPRQSQRVMVLDGWVEIAPDRSFTAVPPCQCWKPPWFARWNMQDLRRIRADWPLKPSWWTRRR